MNDPLEATASPPPVTLMHGLFGCTMLDVEIGSPVDESIFVIHEFS